MLWNPMAALETASCRSVTHDELGFLLCLMHNVGTILACLFC
jgi:hypothetical protein